MNTHDFHASIEALAGDLRLGNPDRRCFHAALHDAEGQLFWVLQQQLGTLTARQLDLRPIEKVLLALAGQTGAIVNGARDLENLATVREGHKTMLAGLVAGATMALHDPEKGQAVQEVFGSLVDVGGDQCPKRTSTK